MAIFNTNMNKNCFACSAVNILRRNNQTERVETEQFKNIENTDIKDDFKVQYLTVFESKKCKRYQGRESSQCEAEEAHF